MRKVHFAATAALVFSSFTPVALPVFVSSASAAPIADAAMCLAANPGLLGPAANRHYYTAWLNSVGENTTTTDVGDPARSGNSGNVFVTVTTIEMQPEVTQTCQVLNKNGNATSKPTFTLVVQEEEEISRTEDDVKVCQNVGGRGGPGTEVTQDGLDMGFTQGDCEDLTSDDA